PLRYDYNALEPVIDGRTMEIHYSKHAAGYCNNLNNAVVQSQIDISSGLEHILSNVSQYPVAIRNQGGGHYNHELFWKCMKPGGSLLKEGQLKKDLLQTFGSIENIQKIFSDVALSRFGSGWAWLMVTPKGNLLIDSTPNQDNPLMDISSVKGYPLLGLDVWEHAYYLKYQNRRAEYIKQWWGIVDWDFVSQRYLDLAGRP
ncbi:MAG: superoxide dismutase, partial [Bacteroidota bacterium]